MKIFSLKKKFNKLGKKFIKGVSGCAYCPLKDSCEIVKNKKEKMNIK